MLNVIIIIISAIITQCIIIILFNKINLIPAKWSINSKSLNLVPVYNSNLKVYKLVMH